MGKSYRKNPIFGNCGSRSHRSEKFDKQLCNRKLRRKVKDIIDNEDFDSPMPLPNEVHNVWSMAKDGKSFWKGATKRDMGK